jgi:xanthine dehydrogenase accessory factor
MALVGDTVEKYLVPVPEEMVRNAKPGSAFVVLTHDHSLDFLITSEALARGDARYVGMIGSNTKRKVFERWCTDTCDCPVDMKKLACPIGAAGRGDKHPEVIAAFVVAEVISRLIDGAVEPVETLIPVREREKIYG